MSIFLSSSSQKPNSYLTQDEVKKPTIVNKEQLLNIKPSLLNSSEKNSINQSQLSIKPQSSTKLNGASPQKIQKSSSSLTSPLKREIRFQSQIESLFNTKQNSLNSQYEPKFTTQSNQKPQSSQKIPQSNYQQQPLTSFNFNLQGLSSPSNSKQQTSQSKQNNIFIEQNLNDVKQYNRPLSQIVPIQRLVELQNLLELTPTNELAQLPRQQIHNHSNYIFKKNILFSYLDELLRVAQAVTQTLKYHHDQSRSKF